ncbi:MAG: phosphatidate cytidylyltransferase [Filimonas sp.]|nr:phosphatidate cytidylyltransferase [Filimonas sp.]
MAFNVDTFKTRALSAVFFVIIMLTGLLLNHWTFFLLFSVIHFGCWHEYQKLIGLIDPGYQKINPFHKYGIMLLGWGFMLFMTNKSYRLGGFYFAEIGKWLMIVFAIAIPVVEVLLSKKFNPKVLVHSLLGLLYISLSWGLMINIRNYDTRFTEYFSFPDFGWRIPIVLIASIWINDTMAYIVGSFIGKTPFSKISPKKTWEGTVGGAILAVVVVTLVGNWAYMGDTQLLLVVSAIAAIFGTAGDLLESKLKRMAGVKDSGSMMPGHGGFLDRFDSLLLATPIVWLYLKLVMA